MNQFDGIIGFDQKLKGTSFRALDQQRKHANDCIVNGNY